MVPSTGYKIGDRFVIPAEDIYSCITDVVRDEDGKVILLIVSNYNGKFLSIDMNLYKSPEVEPVH